MILAFTLVTDTNSLNTYILIIIHTQTIFNAYILLKEFKNDTLKEFIIIIMENEKLLLGKQVILHCKSHYISLFVIRV